MKKGWRQSIPVRNQMFFWVFCPKNFLGDTTTSLALTAVRKRKKKTTKLKYTLFIANRIVKN